MQVIPEKKCIRSVSQSAGWSLNETDVMFCFVLFCSGLDGLMNILQSFPEIRPFLIVAETRQAW